VGGGGGGGFAPSLVGAESISGGDAEAGGGVADFRRIVHD
jgi:hypothetical protein